jgi:hypothetical protein
MTLVLTKVTTDGIAMAADAALTEVFGPFQRILTGAAKLLPHHPSLSCLGTWGHAVLPNPTQGADPIPLELVLRQFLGLAKSIGDADVLSAKLVDWLNDNFETAKGVVGVDLASVRAGRDQASRVVHRIMNAEAVDAKPARFRRYTIRPPGDFSDDDAPIIVAGDINAQVWVDEIRAGIRNAAIKVGRSLPESAEEVAAWLAAMVRTVSDLYHNLQIHQSIGGPVTTAVLRPTVAEVRVR